MKYETCDWKHNCDFPLFLLCYAFCCVHCVIFENGKGLAEMKQGFLVAQHSLLTLVTMKTMNISHLPLPTLWAHSTEWLSNEKAHSYRLNFMYTEHQIIKCRRSEGEEESRPERKAPMLLTQHNFWETRHYMGWKRVINSLSVNAYFAFATM